MAQSSMVQQQENHVTEFRWQENKQSKTVMFLWYSELCYQWPYTSEFHLTLGDHLKMQAVTSTCCTPPPFFAFLFCRSYCSPFLGGIRPQCNTTGSRPLHILKTSIPTVCLFYRESELIPSLTQKYGVQHRLFLLFFHRYHFSSDSAFSIHHFGAAGGCRHGCRQRAREATFTAPFSLQTARRIRSVHIFLFLFQVNPSHGPPSLLLNWVLSHASLQTNFYCMLRAS